MGGYVTYFRPPLYLNISIKGKDMSFQPLSHIHPHSPQPPSSFYSKRDRPTFFTFFTPIYLASRNHGERSRAFSLLLCPLSLSFNSMSLSYLSKLSFTKFACLSHHLISRTRNNCAMNTNDQKSSQPLSEGIKGEASRAQFEI